MNKYHSAYESRFVKNITLTVQSSHSDNLTSLERPASRKEFI